MTVDKNSKIAVLMGGLSKERDVSLRTGAAIAHALVERGYTNTRGIDVTKNISEELSKQTIDVVFNALHGRFGEDGAIQGVLEYLHIPYTGCGVMSSSLSMDKGVSKALFEHHKIPTLPWHVSHKADSFDDFKNALLSKMNLPVIGKPANEGSTIGIVIVKDPSDLASAFSKTHGFDDMVIWEPFKIGVDIAAAILKNEALPLVEIVPKSGFYDYESKYTVGATNYYCPARIDDKLSRDMQEVALKAFASVHAQTFGRVDFLLEPNGLFWVLEVNTIPGMTQTSLFPMAAKAKGYTFGQVCEMILLDASLRRT